MAQRKRMDETELAALVSAEIADAIEYDRSEISDNRQRAIEYYRGEMDDLPAEDGRSSVVSHDVRDTIGWILPGIMRVFFGGDDIVSYQPEGPEDDESAKQASDYVNHAIQSECDGYQVFWDAFHDALLHGNGVIKHWWDDTPKVTVHVLSGLTDDQLAQVIGTDDVEVLEHTAEEQEIEMPAPEQPAMPQGMPGPEGEMMGAGGPPQGQQMPMPDEGMMIPQTITLHKVKIKRTEAGGRLRIVALPPEEFLIDRQATDIEDARFCAHRTLKTRSELIEMGFDRDKVEELPGHGTLGFDETSLARHDDLGITSPPGSDRSTEEIELFEAYPLVDHDGDGVAERLRVYSAGPSSTEILEWEVWEDEVPFSDIVAERVPHRWKGLSIFEITEDIQRVKTTLQRQMLDNLYQTNVPDRVVNEKAVKNPDALFDRKIGNVIRVDGHPNDAVINQTIPFVAKDALTGIEYMDRVNEMRTGISRASMALDMEALQNQSATAVNAQQSASYSKVELIARNFAEMGLKRIFRCILKLICQNQDRPKTIRLREEWVEMDPRGWNANMDAVVNVGLGSGSRDRDMAMLAQVIGIQQGLLQQVGGPITTYGKKLALGLTHSLQKFVTAGGLRGPEQFFPEPNPEEMQEIAQVLAQAGEGDDKQAEMQAKMEMEQAELQADQQKSQAQMQLAASESQMKHQQRMAEIQAESAAKRYQIDQEMQLKREQLAEELLLKREQLAEELALKREMNVMNAAVKADAAASSPVRMGGNPG